MERSGTDIYHPQTKFLRVSVCSRGVGGSVYDITSCLTGGSLSRGFVYDITSCLTRGSLFRGVSVWYHILSDQGGLCPGGSLSGESLSRLFLSTGVSVQGSLYRTVSVQGVSVRETPSIWEIAIRILLECILVLNSDAQFRLFEKKFANFTKLMMHRRGSI